LGRVDKRARVCVRQDYYSVPARNAGWRLSVRPSAMTVEVLDGPQVVAWHERAAGKYAEILALDHYLEVRLPRPPPLRIRQPPHPPAAASASRRTLLFQGDFAILDGHAAYRRFSASLTMFRSHTQRPVALRARQKDGDMPCQTSVPQTGTLPGGRRPPARHLGQHRGSAAGEVHLGPGQGAKRVAKSQPQPATTCRFHPEPVQAGRVPGRQGSERGHQPRSLGALVQQDGVPFQRLKTWRASKGPDYAAKKARIERLHTIADREVAPEPGEPEVVFCVDESGR
jgi:hypothetical protein